MSFIDNLKIGYTSYIEGVKFLFKHKLWYYFIFPAIISVGVFYLGQYFVSLEQEINQQLKENSPESLNELIWMNIELVISDGLYVFFTKFTKYFVILILSPLLAMLSEKIEEILTGNVYPLNIVQLWHDIQRGGKIAIRNIMWEYFFLFIVLGLASFFPKNELKMVLIFSIPILIGFYYFGFGFIDYINERRRLNIQQSSYFVRNHRGLAFAIGSIYSLVFMVPEFLKYLAPETFSNTYLFLTISTIAVTIAPIIAITAATLSMHKIVGLENNEWAIKKKKNVKNNQQTDSNQKELEEESKRENDPTIAE